MADSATIIKMWNKFQYPNTYSIFSEYLLLIFENLNKTKLHDIIYISQFTSLSHQVTKYTNFFKGHFQSADKKNTKEEGKLGCMEGAKKLDILSMPFIDFMLFFCCLYRFMKRLQYNE